MQETPEEHFSREAKTWDSKIFLRNSIERASVLIKQKGMVDADTDVLDIGCGTGTLLTHLLPHVRLAIGVDTAAGMVDKSNENFRAAGAGGRALAVCLDVSSPGGLSPTGAPPPDVAQAAREQQGSGGSGGSPALAAGSGGAAPATDVVQVPRQYGLVTSHMTLHHVKDVERMMAAAAGYLQPGGKLAVFDLLKTDTSNRFHPRVKHHTVHHIGGFSEQQMEQLLQGAGLEGVTVEVAHRFTKEVEPLQKEEGRGRPEELEFCIFMAQGQKTVAAV